MNDATGDLRNHLHGQDNPQNRWTSAACDLTDATVWAMEAVEGSRFGSSPGAFRDPICYDFGAWDAGAHDDARFEFLEQLGNLLAQPSVRSAVFEALSREPRHDGSWYEVVGRLWNYARVYGEQADLLESALRDFRDPEFGPELALLGERFNHDLARVLAHSEVYPSLLYAQRWHLLGDRLA